MKVMTIFGTRPEAIKLAPVIAALDATPGIVSRTCVTAQHRGMLDQVLELNAIVPDHDLDLMRPAQTLDAITAALLTGIGDVLDTDVPDRVIVQGDTATAMIGALAAYYRRIPVSHVEAGLRSGDIYRPWPEEVNRRIVSTIADQHFAPTTTAAEALYRESIDPATVHVTGNTVIDALLATRAKIAATPGLTKGLDLLFSRFTKRRIILVTTHRRENFAAMTAVAEAISALAQRSDVAVIFPVHPNPNVAGVMERMLKGRDNIAMIPPQDYPHFVALLDKCDFVLTDSGGVQEEAPALGKPVLVMRDTTERPEGVTAGTARLIGTDPHRIVSEAHALLDDRARYDAMSRAHNPFGDGHASGRIVEVILRQ
jgi:UDP-N-acetylglucosamine 2-epimerase (non-hydrolysing)